MEALRAALEALRAFASASVVTEAGPAGAASGVGRRSSRATWSLSTARGFGVGNFSTTSLRCAYVYVLPYTSCSTMYRPSRRPSPTLTMRPSLTATTGAPERAKILMPLRCVLDSITYAGFLPSSVALMSLRLTSLA